MEASGEVPRGEKMLYSGTDPESYITECTLVYEDYLEEERGVHFVFFPGVLHLLPREAPSYTSIIGDI